MIVGVLKEIKTEEYRVAMTPAGVEVLRQRGHAVLVEKDAGLSSGFPNDAYLRAGAELVPGPGPIFERAEMLLHVKEPVAEERKKLRPGQIVLAYLHLAADEPLTRDLIARDTVNIALETIQRPDGSLPLLMPMSEVAGRMAVQEGAKYLEMSQGGGGILLGGVPGVDPATVLIIGGGVVGVNAAKMACGLGAKAYLLDTSVDRLRYLSDVMPKNCFLIMSNPATIRKLLPTADLVIGAVLVTGARAPHVITRDMLPTMKRGAVMVDVSIDQGGCFETSKPTTHDKPTYVVDGVVHYCVANMPAAVAKTSTLALTNATLPYIADLADKGWRQACRESEEICRGVNVAGGRVTYRAVAEHYGMEYTPLAALLD